MNIKCMNSWLIFLPSAKGYIVISTVICKYDKKRLLKGTVSISLWLYYWDVYGNIYLIVLFLLPFREHKVKSLILLSFWHAGIDFATRKIASLLKPQKVIKQEGDSFTIRTLSTFRNYQVSFKIGEEFTEETKGLDNRSCQVSWKKKQKNNLTTTNVCPSRANECSSLF